MSACIATSVASWKRLALAIQEELDLWRGIFNYERPHEKLGMRCPGEIYVASERKYQGTPEDLDYPQMCTRRVSRRGTITVDGNQLFLSTSLAGWSVGLKPIREDVMEVCFGRLLLGQVDLATSIRHSCKHVGRAARVINNAVRFEQGGNHDDAFRSGIDYPLKIVDVDSADTEDRDADIEVDLPDVV